ncbi:MAG: hypothetical protein D6806_14945 [Deltaproteobacteria bacterium]|nr:MAG: hypothetical protein D6806_14945 [Deltaproteobacteria bacterium]
MMLQIFLDGELDSGESWLVQSHLESCRECSRLAEYHGRFTRALRARLGRVTAPDELREEIQSMLSSPSSWGARPNRLLWGTVPVAAAVLVMVALTWTVTSAFTPMVDEVVKQHSTGPRVEMAATDTSAIENWLRSKVDFNVALPRFGKRRLSPMGAGLSRLARHRAAMVSYSGGNRSYSLFVVDAPEVKPPANLCQRVRRYRLCLTERKGYTVVMWRSRGLLYTMVGDAPAAEMVELVAASASGR